MQDKDYELLRRSVSWRATLPFHKHKTHTQPATSTSAPCKLSLISSCSDPCQTSVTFGERGYRVTHTHTYISFCLFICLCRFVFWCLPSTCLPSTLLSSALLLSHSPVLSFNLPALAVLLWSVYEHQSVRFLLTTDPLYTFSEFHWNFMENLLCLLLTLLFWIHLVLCTQNNLHCRIVKQFVIRGVNVCTALLHCSFGLFQHGSLTVNTFWI